MQNKLKNLRTLNGLSLLKLGEISGVSPSTIMKMEKSEELEQYDKLLVMSVFKALGIYDYDNILIIKHKGDQKHGCKVNNALAKYTLEIIEGKRGQNIERTKKAAL